MNGSFTSAVHGDEQPGVPLSAKEIVKRFASKFYTEKKVREAFEAWVAPDYIQHNPLVGPGREDAIAFLEQLFNGNPESSFAIKRFVGDDDLVAVHLHAKMNSDDRGVAVVDIFRVENGVVVEHWDVIQPIPERDANGNGMF